MNQHQKLLASRGFTEALAKKALELAPDNTGISFAIRNNDVVRLVKEIGRLDYLVIGFKKLSPCYDRLTEALYKAADLVDAKLFDEGFVAKFDKEGNSPFSGAQKALMKYLLKAGRVGEASILLAEANSEARTTAIEQGATMDLKNAQSFNKLHNEFGAIINNQLFKANQRNFERSKAVAAKA
jgi:hypothetical protein